MEPLDDLMTGFPLKYEFVRKKEIMDKKSTGNFLPCVILEF